jgi:prophage DNA circulation protein
MTSKNTDKAALSPNWRRYVVETDAFAKFVGRILRAYSRRVAQGDIEALADLVNLSGEVELVVKEAVLGLHDFGYSWTEIADRVGVSRQAARQRWSGEL